MGEYAKSRHTQIRGVIRTYNPRGLRQWLGTLTGLCPAFCTRFPGIGSKPVFGASYLAARNVGLLDVNHNSIIIMKCRQN